MNVREAAKRPEDSQSMVGAPCGNGSLPRSCGPRTGERSGPKGILSISAVVAGGLQVDRKGLPLSLELTTRTALSATVTRRGRFRIVLKDRVRRAQDLKLDYP
jgi:hypothetical protein